ncbi:helix-turn-helix domain-containing protein [Enterococcus sp. BWR-S5]|uniref:helix-turn-helix domain-containing protein n=1 Tax=Enterococcus sp. BWR-S5 TaxID=2787714 RepID=UPI0019208CBC|nr:helix-turn-helix domain-containing protein [Enterococcus sp. BWR-S5]MBL1224466.1 helix-turn-helix domain-containing protein [Enterococcus sp. BWR-S5]
MIYETMLNKNEREKIEVYALLTSLPEGVYSKNGLVAEFSFSYNRLGAILDDIHQDIEELTQKKLSILFDGKVVISSKWIFLDYYVTYILKNSISYKFLIALLSEEEESIEAFCETHNVSESYTRRNTKGLVSYLDRFDIHVIISSVRIIGDERLIRIIMTYLIWNCSFGDEFREEFCTIEEIGQAFDPILLLPPKTSDSYRYSDKLRQLHGEIMYRRLAKGHTVEDKKEYDILIAGNYTGNFQPLQKLFDLSEETAEKEARFLAFLAFYGPTYSFEDDPLFDVSRDELKHRSSDMYQFFTEFNKKVLHPLLENYPNPGRITLLEANLVNILFNYMIFRQRIPFFSLVQREVIEGDEVIFPIIYSRVYGFIESYPFSSNWQDGCLNDMSLIMSQLILPTLKEHQKSIKLNVAILSEDNYVYINNVKSMLADFTFVELIPYTLDNRKKIDLLVYPSKLFHMKDEEIQTLTLSLTSLKDDFFGVYNTMKTVYEEKLQRYFLEILEEQA